MLGISMAKKKRKEIKVNDIYKRKTDKMKPVNLRKLIKKKPLVGFK